MKRLLTILILFISTLGYAQQSDNTSPLVDLTSGESLVVLNEKLSGYLRKINALENNVQTVSTGGTGQDLSAATTGSILYFSSTGVITTLAAGTTDSVLTISSGIPSWDGETTETLTSSGNWTVPTGITKINILLQGGGGGGGGKSVNVGSGGGGGGGLLIIYDYVVTPGASLAYSVGAAGVGATSLADGGDGGNSTFNAVFIAYGGEGGAQETATKDGTGGTSQKGTSPGDSASQTGGVQGTAYGYDLGKNGGDGYDPGSGFVGGGGGGTIYAAGGNGGTDGNSGSAGTATTGAGGGGGGRNGNGGNGGTGTIILNY